MCGTTVLTTSVPVYIFFPSPLSRPNPTNVITMSTQFYLLPESMRALALASPMVNSSLTTCLITTEPINVNFDPCWGSARRPDHISLVQYGTKLEKKF